MDSSDVLVLLVASIVVLSILGVATNTTVCMVMFRSKRIWKNPSSFLVTHLSIVDLLFRLIVVPLHIRRLTYTAESSESGALFLATQSAGMNYATVIFVTLTMIAFERYISIAHPLKRLQKSTRNRVAVLVSIWTYSLVVTMVVLGVFEIASLNDYNCLNAAGNVSLAENVTRCDRKIVLCIARSNHWTTMFAATLYICFGVLLPVVTMVVLYMKITAILWRRSRTGTIHGRVARSVRKSLRMLVIIVCGFLFCWVPSIVIRPLLALSVVSCEAELALIIISQLTQSSSSIINPIIYAVYSKDFFNEYRKFCCTFPRCRDGDRFKTVNNSYGINLKVRKARKVSAVAGNS